LKEGILMKNTIWILNSLLLSLCILIGGFLYFFRQAVPKRTRLILEKVVTPPQKSSFIVNTAHIYENDLFGTYSSPAVAKEPLVVQLPEFPIIPIAQEPLANTQTPPQFLEPLAYILSGVFVDNEDAKSRAIIINNKNQVQKMYSIGDMIEDAELLRIFDNSVLLVRSNGQEETLFINKQAALEDLNFNSNASWENAILQQSDVLYTVDKFEFTKRIPHLSQFLEVIDATTIYKKGKAFGVRIGKIKSESAGMALGLRPGDVITSIDGISTAYTQGRVEIYSRIRNIEEDGIISVEVIRNGQSIHYTYIIKKIDAIKLPMIASAKRVSIKESHILEKTSIVKQNKKLLFAESKKSFMPRIEQVHKKNKQAMMRRKGYKGITESLLT
jgi:type II secretion system protein C